MSYFEDLDATTEFSFSEIAKQEFTAVEKVQHVEELVKECARDLAFSRDEAYVNALKDNTIIMIRQGETAIKKFKSQENMYISIPANVYEDVEAMDEFSAYHHVMDILKLSISAPEFREKNEDGELNFIEAEVIDKASKNYENQTGEQINIEHMIERDDFDQPVALSEDTKTVFEPKKFTATKSDGSKDEDKDDEDAEKASKPSTDPTSESGGSFTMTSIDDEVNQEKQQMQAVMEEQSYTAQYTSQSITNTDQKTLDDISGSCFNGSRYAEDETTSGILTTKVLAGLNNTVNNIAKSLRGYEGRHKRMMPSKRLSSKEICSDLSDKIYVGKDVVNGRFIDQNIVVDCSGSMGGSPMEDAVKLCYVFNKLAQEDLVQGNIVLTESSNNMCIKMPVHDDVIMKLGGTGGGEGLTKTLNKFKDKLRNKNVIVMTDGDLVEEPIPENFWAKGRMNCVGMYINDSVKYEDLPGYDTNMKRWFPKTIIRNSFEEAVQKLIQLGLTASKK